ncbi:MAG: CBS domain-containing protein [Deltaproteobacteria bacterium]|nr:CBS domain-containing protein [Deltaproteobacteria bacterium]
MIPKARELMEKRVVAVAPDAALMTVHRLFVEEGISGAPVVDETDRVIGVITSMDLLRSVEAERDTARVDTDYFRDILPYSSPDWGSGPEDLQDRLGELRVSDAMTLGVISVSPDASAPQVAQTLRENRVHRAFVVEGEALLGVISAFDLLRVVEEWKE